MNKTARYIGLSLSTILIILFSMMLYPIIQLEILYPGCANLPFIIYFSFLCFGVFGFFFFHEIMEKE